LFSKIFDYYFTEKKIHAEKIIRGFLKSQGEFEK